MSPGGHGQGLWSFIRAVLAHTLRATVYSQLEESRNKSRVSRQAVQNWVGFPIPSNTWNQPTARLGWYCSVFSYIPST